MKRYVWIIGVSALVAMLAVVMYLRTRGRISEVALPVEKTEKTTFIRLCDNTGFRLEMRRGSNGWTARSSEGQFVPDASRIADFLQVLHLWEVDEIVSLQDSIGTIEAENMWRVFLKSGSKKIYKKKAFVKEGEVYLPSARGEAYKMMCTWQRSGWKDFFKPSTGIWQNRLLIDLDYFEIESVRVGDSLYGASPQNETRFSAFKQVYFDIPAAADLKSAAPLTEIEVKAKDGRFWLFRILPKLTINGAKDPFKAFVIRLQGPNGTPGDTVEVPYVVLDKMTGGGGGF